MSACNTVVAVDYQARNPFAFAYVHAIKVDAGCHAQIHADFIAQR